eukprot:SAG22_NODE_1058_length_5769_cov_6.433510_6_plen_69_part_00
MTNIKGPGEGGATIDPVLHFFVSTACVLLVSTAQLLFYRLFYQRFIANPCENFLDLLVRNHMERHCLR